LRISSNDGRAADTPGRRQCQFAYFKITG